MIKKIVLVLALLVASTAHAQLTESQAAAKLIEGGKLPWLTAEIIAELIAGGTQIAGDLVPDTDGTYNLGVVTTNEWNHIFIDGTAYLDGLQLRGASLQTNVTAAIAADTTDGADNQQLSVCGGGGSTACTTNGTRGASLLLGGNESGNTGGFNLQSGATGSGAVIVPNNSGTLVVQIGASFTTRLTASTTALVTAADYKIDAGAGKLEMGNGNTLPATCTSGEIFYDDNSDDCANGAGDGAVCVCKTANTWALVANI